MKEYLIKYTKQTNNSIYHLKYVKLLLIHWFICELCNPCIHYSDVSLIIIQTE